MKKARETRFFHRGRTMELTALRGINEKRAKDFAKLGVTDTAGLVRCFPRAYLDMTNRVFARDVLNGDSALIACRLTHVEPLRYTGRVKYLRAWLEQDGGIPALEKQLPALAHSGPEHSGQRPVVTGAQAEGDMAVFQPDSQLIHVEEGGG